MTIFLERYNYFLPKDLIAKTPAVPRDKSRLLVYSSGKISHDYFCNLGRYLKAGDLLVFNNSRVFPARIFGKKLNGGKVEILLLEKSGNSWQAMIGGRTNSGEKIFCEKNFFARVVEKFGKIAMLKFNLSGRKFWRQIAKIGKTPIPPYIIKEIKNQRSKIKNMENYYREHYQTVYAKKIGSAAAPTAGLHFSKKLIGDLQSASIEIATIDLHVGLGTFAPLSAENIRQKKLHSEKFSIPCSTVRKIIKTKKSGGRIIAVGTTTVRALESAADQILSGHKISSSTEIFIQPGYKFKIVDGLITNFHLPCSSLMILVAAFLQQKGGEDGRKKLLELYQIAIKKNYRFYSFGDAMVII